MLKLKSALMQTPCKVWVETKTSSSTTGASSGDVISGEGFAITRSSTSGLQGPTTVVPNDYSAYTKDTLTCSITTKPTYDTSKADFAYAILQGGTSNSLKSGVYPSYRAKGYVDTDRWDGLTGTMTIGAKTKSATFKTFVSPAHILHTYKGSYSGDLTIYSNNSSYNLIGGVHGGSTTGGFFLECDSVSFKYSVRAYLTLGLAKNGVYTTIDCYAYGSGNGPYVVCDPNLPFNTPLTLSVANYNLGKSDEPITVTSCTELCEIRFPSSVMHIRQGNGEYETNTSKWIGNDSNGWARYWVPKDERIYFTLDGWDVYSNASATTQLDYYTNHGNGIYSFVPTNDASTLLTIYAKKTYTGLTSRTFTHSYGDYLYNEYFDAGSYFTKNNKQFVNFRSTYAYDTGDTVYLRWGSSSGQEMAYDYPDTNYNSVTWGVQYKHSITWKYYEKSSGNTSNVTDTESSSYVTHSSTYSSDAYEDTLSTTTYSGVSFDYTECGARGITSPGMIKVDIWTLGPRDTSYNPAGPVQYQYRGLGIIWPQTVTISDISGYYIIGPRG